MTLAVISDFNNLFEIDGHRVKVGGILLSSEQEDNLCEGTSTAVQTDTAQEVSITSEPASDEDTARSVAQKLNIDFIKLSEEKLSPHIVRLLPQRLVTKHNVIAVKFEGDTLYIAMANPLDLPTLDQINLLTGFKVKPLVATEREIIQAVNQHYGVEEMSKQDLIDARFSQELTEQADEKIKGLDLSSGEGQVVRLINCIFRDSIDSLASDVHFEPVGNEMFVRFRVDGILHDCLTVPATMRQEVTSRIKVLAKLDITERRKAQDGHISLKYKGNDYDLRISVLPTIAGEKTVVRILDKNTMLTNLDSLGLDADESALVKSAISRPYGMILVTGPTGSGKTTSLYGMLRSIDAIEKNIITVENPAEYQLDRINQVQIDPKGGETFSGALRSILRQDPDVIMVGEIRDLETAEIAVQAALTGHLVLSTLHTNDAITAITRLKELGIPSFLISSCVIMAMAQRLVRRICPDCKEPYQPDEKTLKLLGAEKSQVGEFVHGKGCGYCFDTGFRGRVGVYEILKIDKDIQNAMLEGKNEIEMKKIAVENGMKTMLDAALIKVSKGQTCIEEVRRVISPEGF